MAKHRVRNLRLREISSVDRPAQVGAVSVLIKRASDPVEDLIKATFDEALKGNMLAEKVQDVFYKAFETWWSGKEAFRKALIDELAAGGDGSVASADFKTWLGSLVDQALGAAKAAGAADAADLEKSFNKAAEDWLAGQERDMTIKTKADLAKAIEAAQAEGDKVTVATVSNIHKAAGELGAEDTLPASGPLAKTAPAVDPAVAVKVERMEKRDALSADLRKHYDALADDTARDAFLGLDDAGKAAELAKAAGDDPVVYTTLDGVDIRKSADPALLAMAKGRDNDRRENARLHAGVEDARLTKRATEELGSIGGDEVGKKALIKAVESITDVPTRTAAEAVLKAANAAAKGLFKRAGSSGGSDPVLLSDDGPEMSAAEQELDTLAKAHAAANPGTTYEAAYATVIQTQAGAQLYKRAVEGGD